MNSSLSSESIVVHGRGTGLIAIAIVIILLAGIIPYVATAMGTVLSWDNVIGIWSTAACIAAGLILVGLCISIRRLILKNQTFSFSSLFSRCSCPLETLTNVTHETDQDLHAYIEFWEGDKIFLSTYINYWNRKELSLLLQELIRRNPSISMDPRVRRFIE